MGKKLFLGLALVLMLTVPVLSKPLTLNEISDSICRVAAGAGMQKAMGTGTAFSEDENSYYILTNYHVIESAPTYITVEFFSRGYKSQAIPAQVIWKAFQEQTDVDFAILKVLKSAFGNRPPRVIPLAPKGYSVVGGQYICAVGCPEGRWANGWEGAITQNMNTRVIFTPPPVGGQSGSGIMVLVRDAKGEFHTRIGAVLTWRINPQVNPIGGAIPISTLQSLVSNKASYNAVKVPANWKPVSTTEIDWNKPCSKCGKTARNHALASDGQLYCTFTDPITGYLAAKPPEGVKIVSFDPAQCGPFGCPVPGTSPVDPYDPNGLIFGRRQQPQPRPILPNQPLPNLPRPNRPTPPNGGGTNPYGVDPPLIPGIDGNVPTPTPTPIEPPKPVEPIKPDGLSTQLREMADKLDEAEKKKAELEKAIEGLQLEKTALEAQLTEANKGIVQQATETVVAHPIISGLFGGIITALLVFLWKRIGQNIAAKQLDKVEDFVQKKVTDAFGPDAGLEVRQIMDGLEEQLFGFVETFLMEQRTVSKVTDNAKRKLFGNNRNKAAEVVGKAMNNLGATNSENILAKMLGDLVRTSKATEVTEKDSVGLAKIAELEKRLAGLENPTPEQAKEIVQGVKDIEKNENDEDVLVKIKALEDTINKLLGGKA